MSPSSRSAAEELSAPDDMVAEVAGPPFTPVEAGASIALGLSALLGAGLMGLLLAALAGEGRLSTSGIGLAAMLEALITAVVTSAAGIFLKPVRLRLVAALAAAALVAIDLATLRASGSGVLVVRALAGLPEGLLLWITIGFISRTATPERWAAVLFTGMGLTQLAAASALSAFVLPRFGANGGYLAVAVAAGFGVLVAPFVPRELGASAAGGETSGVPPFRGCVALLGTLAMSSSAIAVSVYLIPIALQAGLPMGIARAAISVSLASNMVGGALATWIAGRVRYIVVFGATALTFLATWAVYATHAPAWLFLVMTGLAGLAAYIAGPFLVAMTVDADPTRRAAMQSGAVQLLAGASGPLLAALAVRDHEVRGVLTMAAVLQLTGIAIAVTLHQLVVRDRRRQVG